MKDSLRRLAIRFVTGPAGRLVAFVVDLTVAAARYWSARLRGRRPW